jgi:hypothetical protein
MKLSYGLLGRCTFRVSLDDRLQPTCAWLLPQLFGHVPERKPIPPHEI